MAIITLGGGVTDIRGSIGGNTFARNAGGNYIRCRKKPINPRSASQVNRRSILSQVTTAWSKTLTELQRTAWRSYASETSWTNRLGQAIQINGLAAFVRTNTLLVLIGEALQVAAPAQNGRAGSVTFTFTATTSTQKLAFTEPSAPWDKDVDKDFCIIFHYHPQSPGVLHIPKGSRYSESIEGDSVTPETFPLDMDPVYPFLEDQQVTCGITHLDELGRVSARSFYRVAAVA